MDSQTLGSVKDIGPEEWPMYENDLGTPGTEKEPFAKLSDVPQGPGSGMDSDTVDGFQACPVNVPTPNAILPLNQNGKFDTRAVEPKAWVHFNGADGVIRDSFNVTSVARNGAGDYTITFTTAFANANYCMAATGMRNSAGGSALIVGPLGDGTYTTYYTTTTIRILTVDITNTAVDGTAVNCMFFGDQ